MKVGLEMSRMIDIPDAPWLNGPDTSEDEPTIKSLIEEAREALNNVEAALKDQSVTRSRQRALAGIYDADAAVDAAWNMILEEL